MEDSVPMPEIADNDRNLAWHLVEHDFKVVLFNSLQDFLKSWRKNELLREKKVDFDFQPILPTDSPEAAKTLNMILERLYDEDDISMKKVNPSTLNFDSLEDDVRFSLMNAESNQDAIRKDERQLERCCDKFGIALEAFQIGGKFQMTRGVTILFTYILDNFFEKRNHYSVIIKHPQIEALIDLRSRYIDALYSLDIDEERVTQYIMKFEEKTGCPPKTQYIPHSQLTLEAVQYMEEDINLSRAEWEMFKDQAEYKYKHCFRPQFIDYCMKILLKDFLHEIGKDDQYPYDKDPLEGWLASMKRTDQS